MRGLFTYRYHERGRLKWNGVIENFITNAGCNKLLNAMFNGVSAGTSWYIGLMHLYYGSTDEVPSVTDTLSTRPWHEYALTGGNRPSIAQMAAAGQALNSANPITFTLSSFTSAGGADIHPEIAWGLFLTDQQSQSSTTGTIMAISSFNAGYGIAGVEATQGLTVTSGGTFDVTYKLQF